MLNVHLRINDAATGKPTPVRLRVEGPDGFGFPPLGYSATFPVGTGEAVGGHVRIDKENWWSVTGSCEIPLPAGVPLRIRATKGPEYDPIDETLTLGPGQMAVRLAIQKWIDHGPGWVRGDSRCHLMAPHAAWLDAAAEGLDVVHLLAKVRQTFSHDGHTYPMAEHLSAFSGAEAAVEKDGHAVVVNTSNAHPILGRVSLLNGHRVVHPLTFGGEASDDWGVCDWCDQCHRKTGLTVWTEAFQASSGLLGGEPLVAAILGKIDAIEIDPRPRAQSFLPWYYRMLNAGIRLPLVGGSAKESNALPLGVMRTYAKSAETGPAGWAEGVRAGRTFVTNGPLLSLDVQGVGPGGTAVGIEPIPVTATAESHGPFDRVELVFNGQVVATGTPPAAGRPRATVAMTRPWPESGWVAARCVGTEAFAHTSPVSVNVPGVPFANRRANLPPLAKAVGEVKAWAEAEGRYADPRRKAALIERCDAALRVLGAGPG
jgi:hypothetical protein